MASKISLLTEDLLCCICCDIFRDPVVLSCSHSMCKTCLKRFWETNRSRECPVCRRRSSREDPPLNRVLKNVCETFIESRTQRSSVRGEKLCSLHNEALKLFCLEDQQPVCVVCQVSKTHKNHNFCPIDEAVTDCKINLQKALEPLKENQKVLEEAKRGFERTAAHIKMQAQNTERKIKEEFEKIHQFLRGEEAARIAALKEEEKKKSQMVRRKIKEINGRIAPLSNKIRNIEKEMEAADVPLLQNLKSTITQAQHKPKDPEKISGALIDVAKYISNLKFRVWEKMQEILHYTPVTLDPNTAQPYLHLSDDLTAVENRDQKSSLPDNPERFDELCWVLGSEGFNSGTHCWDVQVGDRDAWSLGVIPESVTRKGDSVWDSMLRLFYSKKREEYWIRCPGQPDQTLTFKEKVQKVRVQLDWDGGKVTFTDLLTRTHLHTITHSFSERVLPLFCNMSVHPLRLLPMKVSVNVEQQC